MNMAVTKIEVTVLESYVLSGLVRGVDLKGKVLTAGTENLDALCSYLNGTRFDLGVYGVLCSLCYLTDDGNNGLLGDARKHLIVRENYLSYAVVVAKVNEKYASVVSYGIDPAANGYGLTDMLRAELITSVCSLHIILPPNVFITNFSFGNNADRLIRHGKFKICRATFS